MIPMIQVQRGKILRVCCLSTSSHSALQPLPPLSSAAVCERMTQQLKAGDIEGVLMTYRQVATRSRAHHQVINVISLLLHEQECSCSRTSSSASLSASLCAASSTLNPYSNPWPRALRRSSLLPSPFVLSVLMSACASVGSRHSLLLLPHPPPRDLLLPPLQATLTPHTPSPACCTCPRTAWIT